MARLVAALFGIGLADATGIAIFDGIASVAISVILAVTAALLAWECKSLLIGMAADARTVASIRAIAGRRAQVRRTNEVLTMHMGPHDVLVNLSFDFNDSLDAGDVEATISALEHEIKRAHPEITRVFIEAQS